jgi:signal transduction histidine kinase
MDLLMVDVQAGTGQSTARDHGHLLRQLGAEVAGLAGVDAVGEHLVARLGRALDVHWLAISLHARAPGTVYRWGDCPDAVLDPSTGAWRVPLVARRETIGALVLGPKRLHGQLVGEDVALISILAPLVATTLRTFSLIDQLERLAPTLGERERTLADLNVQLLRTQEDERRRIALDLHDDPLQRAILLAREMTGAPDDPTVQRWRAVVGEIIDGLRATSAALRPPNLDDFGLVAAIEWLADVVRARADLDLCLEAATAGGAPFGRLPAELELALFRIAQEALNNCLKHAQCTEVVVRLRREGPSIQLTVADDGRGCADDADDADGPLHLGLLGMQERLRPWGGTVALSPREGGGTVVTAEVTLESDDGHAV